LENKFPYTWYLKNGYPAKAVDHHRSTVFSCFAGGGGSSMGYKLAGYDVLGYNEIDPRMAQLYDVNHNPEYSYITPIQKLKKSKKLPSELYNLDILDGSPPCSTFSLAASAVRDKYWGKKKKFREGQVEQVLDTLFFDFIDLTAKLQPKIVVSENVQGITFGTAMTYGTNYVRDIHIAFDKAGYNSQHFILDASKMGVPQKRIRIFFIALRKDFDKFNSKFNLFETRPELELNFNFPKITFSEIDEGTKVKREKIGPKSARSYISKGTPRGRWQTEKQSNRGKVGTVGFGYTVVNNLVPNTMTGAGRTSYLNKSHNYVSNNELSKIASFPLDYNFESKKSRSLQYVMGMSVPPVMMAQISYHLFTMD